MSTQPQPLAPKELRHWTADEEHSLIRLHDIDHKTFAEIGTCLARTAAAVQQRYSAIKRRQYSSAVPWTPLLDSSIINGRANLQGIAEIARSLKISKEAVSERWHTLQKEGQVPEEVLTMWRRK
jgi:hypothetical protein